MKEKVIAALGKTTDLPLELIKSHLETPPDPKLGDYAFPCFILAKQFKKKPNQISQELAKIIPKNDFEKVEAVGPYLNFFVNRSALAQEILKKIQKEKEVYGSTKEGRGKHALIEHTSINPNASPHVGRARNAIIGDSLVRLFKFLDFKVETHYFVNDVGKQIAMLVLAGEKKKKPNFNDLLALYININKKIEKNPELEKKVFGILKRLEEGDQEIKKKFRDIVNICIKGQSKILSELDIKYDFFDFESKYLWSKRTEEILTKLQGTGKLFVDKEGRTVLNQEGYNLALKAPVLVLTRADRTSLYPLRDIAYTIEKIDRARENNYIVLGEDHRTYFQQIKAVLDLLGYPAPKVIHYAFVLLTKGKMSTRHGNVVLLEDFMKEALEKAKQELKKRYGKIDEKRAKAIAYSAIKYAILKVSPEKNVNFDLETALSFEGDTGPYLLYTYARAKSILRKAKYKSPNYQAKDLTGPEKALIFQLGSFPEIVKHTFENLSPNLLANYAFRLSQQFNEFYHSTPVINSEKEAFRLTLVDSFSQVLKNALSLLGISVIEEM